MAKTKYYVDKNRYDGDPGCVDKEWKKFPSLAKAVRYAIEHELGADNILDSEGHSIPDLDLDDPQWWNRRRLETEYRHRLESLNHTRKALAKEQDSYRNRQITMIRAGYVPIELITSRLLAADIEQNQIETTTFGAPTPTFMAGRITVTLKLDGIPDESASEYKQAPFAAFLTELNARIEQL